MSKKGGFTEAEIIAASWRKEMKKLEDNKNTISINNNRKKDFDARDKLKITNDRDRRRRRSTSRNRYSRSPSRNNNDNINNNSKSYNRYNNEKSYDSYDNVQVDEFGRDLIPGMTKKRYTHHRSRSNSPHHNSNNHNDSSNSWRHDKYIEIVDDRYHDNENEYDDKYNVRRVPNDYRPPSPTWISKAGGVAIMKKK